MKYLRIETAGRPAPLPNVAIEELDLGGGRYARVVITRAAVDVRSIDPRQAEPQNHVTITRKAVEIDAAGRICAQPNGLASATRTFQENVDTTAIGDTHTWRPGWVRRVPPVDVNWHADNLPEGCTVVDALPATGTSGQCVYLDPVVYAWADGIISDAADAMGDELLRILRNSDQLAGVSF